MPELFLNNLNKETVIRGVVVYTLYEYMRIEIVHQLSLEKDVKLRLFFTSDSQLEFLDSP